MRTFFSMLAALLFISTLVAQSPNTSLQDADPCDMGCARKADRLELTRPYDRTLTGWKRDLNACLAKNNCDWRV